MSDMNFHMHRGFSHDSNTLFPEKALCTPFGRKD